MSMYAQAVVRVTGFTAAVADAENTDRENTEKNGSWFRTFENDTRRCWTKRRRRLAKLPSFAANGRTYRFCRESLPVPGAGRQRSGQS